MDEADGGGLAGVDQGWIEGMRTRFDRANVREMARGLGLYRRLAAQEGTEWIRGLNDPITIVYVDRKSVV